MKNLFIPISLGILCLSFASIQAPHCDIIANALPVNSWRYSEKPAAKGDALYAQLELEQYGLSKQAFDYAFKGYEKLVSEHKITRTQLLTICDFSQSSRNKRLYILDIEKQQLLKNTYVAHGRNSGTDYANHFSNAFESLQSSLGFYVTAETYQGEHGLSLRIKGLEPGYNDHAYARTIVVHGAGYVNAARARSCSFMGRSFGCPAVPLEESTPIINMIKEGTCLFVYHPSGNYLQGSKILND